MYHKGGVRRAGSKMNITRAMAYWFLATALVISGFACKPAVSIQPAGTSASLSNQVLNQTEPTDAIYIHVSPPGGGSVTPSSGNYTVGSNVKFTATPAAGYIFSSWWYDITYPDGAGSGGRLGTNLTLNLPIESAETITAYFIALPGGNNSGKNPDITLPPKDIEYKLTVLADPPDAGTLSSVNGTYAAGTSVTINATPADGYKVLDWNIYDNGGIGGTPVNTSYTTVMDSDKVILVSFTSINSSNPVRSTPPQTSVQPRYPLVVIVDPPWAGSVSPSTGMYDAGTNITLVATPAAGYVLSNWNWDNNTLNVTTNSITIVSVHFIASPSIWDAALLYHTGQPIAPGDYFYIPQSYTAGMFGPDSVVATYDDSLVVLIDRKSAGFSGPLTPGMHSATVWLLFKALKPGTTEISVAQVRNGYSDPPTMYTVVIRN